MPLNYPISLKIVVERFKSNLHGCFSEIFLEIIIREMQVVHPLCLHPLCLLYLQLNKSSTETIHNVTKMKEEILRIFQNFSQILNQSSNLKSEADQQRQVFAYFHKIRLTFN